MGSNKMWLYLTGKPWPTEIKPDGTFTIRKTLWEYMPTGSPDFVVHVFTAPNVVCRCMQTICFGVRWKMSE